MGSGYFPSPLELVQLLYVGVPFSYAVLLLCLSLLTLSFDDAICHRLLRFILLPPIIYYFWKACSLYHLFSSCFVASGVATVACYGCFLALQFTDLQFWHSSITRPSWLIRKKDGEKIIVVHRNPEAFLERFFYVFDLFCSLRGTSWISNWEWDWSLYSKSWNGVACKSTRCLRRRDFLIESFKKAIKLFVLLDIVDTIVKCRDWDSQARGPSRLYTIPIWQQCIFAIALCFGTSITLDIHYTAFSAFAVWLGNDPDNWPPLFDSPFQATSVSDFWSNRWHQLFRHVFTQFSIPAVRFVQRSFRGERGLPVTFTRIFCAFGISTMLHLFIMYHAERWSILKHGDGNIDRVDFWDVDVIFFFMAQPFGMIFETCILEAIIVDQMFPSLFYHTAKEPNESLQKKVNGDRTTNTVHSGHVQSQAGTNPPPPRWGKVVTMRVFTWTFLAWTGRRWTNKWIRSGFFNNDAKVVPLSLIRSLWHRKIIC